MRSKYFILVLIFSFFYATVANAAADIHSTGFSETNVIADGERITSGNYVYNNPPTDGNEPDNGESGLIAFSDGALTDGDPSTQATWRGNGTGSIQETIVFDLLKDYPLDQIKIVSNALNEWYGIKHVAIKYRKESVDSYTTLLSQEWYGNQHPLPADVERQNTLTASMSDRKARFIIVELTRYHNWQYASLMDVEIYQGTGSVGATPAPALTSSELLQEISKPSKEAKEGQIFAGNYVYDNPPTDGSEPDNGESGLIDFTDGALTDLDPATMATWRGNGTGSIQETIVFDLLKDYPLDQIKIVSNALNEWYGIKSVAVKFREESANKYFTLLSQAWYGTELPLTAGVERKNTLTVPMLNNKARFIIVELTRMHNWQYASLMDVEIYQGTGTVGAAPAPALTASELLQEISKPSRAMPKEGQITAGNYIYGNAPNAGNEPDVDGSDLIAFSDGAITDGVAVTSIAWKGEASGINNKGTIVVDLLKDYPLSQIKLFSNAWTEYHGVKQVTVKYREEAVDTYSILYNKEWYGTFFTLPPGVERNQVLSINALDKRARFIIIEIYKANTWQWMPLSDIEIYQGNGAVGSNPGAALTGEELLEEVNRPTIITDKYGQYMYEDWAGKVTSDEQLQNEAAEEASQLSGVALDPAVNDQYGGIKSGGSYEGTGFFKLEKIDGVWWFLTPEGHKFFMKGVDATQLDEGGYSTRYLNIDGSPRQVFEELPDPELYAEAYYDSTNGWADGVVSFLKANVMRKYGTDYKVKSTDITKKRLMDWGFNTLSKWSRDIDIQMPYIENFGPPADTIKILWSQDPFDPNYQQILETSFASKLTVLKDDPYLVGYFYDNEAGWDNKVVAEVLRNGSDLPAKGAFVDFIEEKYNANVSLVNQNYGTNVTSFDELVDEVINIDPFTAEQRIVIASDLSGFIQLASKNYYSKVNQAIKSIDTNHLFLGSALTPTYRTSLDWDLGGVEFIDAISLDVYSDDAAYLEAYEAADKPVLNLEFSFNYMSRGLNSFNGAVSSTSIANRGEKYHTFIEGQALSPVFVGFGWFVYYDQPINGRPDSQTDIPGESYNHGLVNQQDQPYTDMVNIMKVTNSQIESYHHTTSEAPTTLTGAALAADIVAPTNTDVTVTITYPAVATVQEYKMGASGAWTAYTVPVIVSDNETVYARGSDAAGNVSNVTNIVVSNIDKAVPTAIATYSSVTAQTVIATITPSESVTILNNGGSSSYTFSFNGSFTFEFVDAAGNHGTATATVNNIVLPSKAKPSIPNLSDDNGQDTGIKDGNYNITMNLWYGDNGRTYKLYENDVLIDTKILTDSSPSAQSTNKAITNKMNGTYRYYVELTNAFGTTTSRIHQVTVTNAAPEKSVLSNDNWDGDGSFKVSMNMWWGTNGSTYNLYENGILVYTQALTNNTPIAQSAATTLTNRAIGTYEYRAELINYAGATSSEKMIVKVTK